MPLSRRSLLHHLACGSAAATIATAAGQRPLLAKDKGQSEGLKPQSWRLMSVWDSNSFFYPYLEAFARQIRLQTQGLLNIELVHPADPRETLTQVSRGSVEMGHGMPLLWESQLPAAPYLMSLPFGLTAQEQWLWLTQGGGQALADEVYSTVGCKYFPGGNLGLTAGGWFKAEIEGLNSIEKLTLHSSGLAAEIWKAAGATVVMLPADQLQAALANDRIGAVEYVSPSQDLNLNLSRSAPYYYFPGWQRPGTLLDFFIHQETWAALAPPLQASLEATIVDFNQQVFNDQTAQNQKALQTLTDQGAKIKMFPDSVLLRLESLTGQFLQARSSQNSQVEKVIKHLIEFRAHQFSWVQAVEVGLLSARRWTWTL